MQETQSLLRQERLKEKLGKQDFHYYMEMFLKPLLKNKQNQHLTKLESEKQIEALRDSTQTATKAIQDHTRAIRESSNTLNKNFQKSITEGIEE